MGHASAHPPPRRIYYVRIGWSFHEKPIALLELGDAHSPVIVPEIPTATSISCWTIVASSAGSGARPTKPMPIKLCSALECIIGNEASL